MVSAMGVGGAACRVWAWANNEIPVTRSASVARRKERSVIAASIPVVPDIAA
jgi:hypothetical protein